MLGRFIRDNDTSTRREHKAINTWLGVGQIRLFVLDRRFIVIFTSCFTNNRKCSSS